MKIMEWVNTFFTEKRIVKLVKCLVAVFIMVLSIFVLARKVPETKMVKDTIESIEESNKTVMEFSGATITTSLALSAFPNDFATPLASTLSDLNMYFIFIFAVLFVEKLVVLEGVKIAFVYIIPASCVLFIGYVSFGKEIFKNFAMKLLILGLAVVFVIPFSTYFTEKVCDDYLNYVNETIEEANAGAEKVNQVVASEEEETTIFDKLSDAFQTATQGVNDLMAYFENVIKRCVNSIAIMIVTSFVLPLLTLFLFRWLLNELFGWNLPKQPINIRLSKGKKTNDETVFKIEDKGEKA